VIGEPRVSTRRIFLLYVHLRDIQPMIWRRLMVPGSLTLTKLHFVLQGAFDWEGYHLHGFQIDGLHYGPAEDDYDDDELDEDKWRLIQLLNVDDHFTYNYDFGDNWIHDIHVEGAENASLTLKKAVCLDGERARPPEDVGGASGFGHFLEVMNSPSHEEYDGLLQWHGGEYRQDHFSLYDTNARVQSRG
jgi:hypothetical protein